MSSESENLFEKAKRLIPGGVNSPVRAFRSVGGTPFFTRSAKGCHLTTADGQELIDYVCTWGPAIHGHNHPRIKNAIAKALEAGTSFGTPGPAEVEMAELIVEVVPSVEKVRMCNSGTEATMSCIRLARGFTGRSKVIKFAGCYHGHVDSLLVKAGSGALTLGNPDSAGVPESFAQETIVLPYNDETALADALNQNQEAVAAVIIEPFPANCGLILPKEGYLNSVRALCSKHNVLLIFDEVICGFGRTGEWFGSDTFGVKPDMLTFAKGVTSGYLPLSGVITSKELNEELTSNEAAKLMHGYTYSGHPTAAVAAIANIEVIESEGLVAEAQRIGKQMESGFKALLGDSTIESFRGIGGIWACEIGEDSIPARNEMIKNGIVCRGIGQALAFCPPLIITNNEIGIIFDTLSDVLKKR